MTMTIMTFAPEYSTDAMLVEGVYKKNRRAEQALYHLCKEYFDKNFMAIFFTGDSNRMEIFQESFITLWENIEKRKIYVEEGVLKGKDGKDFTSSLTTYFMGIARLKYKEWVRQHISGDDHEQDKLCKGDLELYKDLLYDDVENSMIDIIADCISKMSERCREILTLFYYEEKNLEEIMVELQTFASKNALKTAKYKCMENLRVSANNIYRTYINS